MLPNLVEDVPWGMDGHYKVKCHMQGSMTFYGQIIRFYGAISTLRMWVRHIIALALFNVVKFNNT